MINDENYQSPYSYRYSSQEMRAIWSESNKRRIWRKIWVALAQSESEFGLVSAEQVEDLTQHKDQIDMSRALQIEAEIHHDLMAELKTFAEQCPVGGKIIHLGATSMDIEDNAEILRLQQALDILIKRLGNVLAAFVEKINQYSDHSIIAWTHLQPAEPTTLGYRFAVYAQDFLEDYKNLKNIRISLKGKGFKGAVGNAASYCDLLSLQNYPIFEERLSELIGLSFYPVTTQTYPRKQDYTFLSALASLAASIHKYALDLRLLQSPPIGEIHEPFGDKQVGSSAMPFKRNPILSEKMDSLARLISEMPQVAWQNAANNCLERTLDDSANRRTLLPEACLICEELLITAEKVTRGLVVDSVGITRNLKQYGPFASTERLLMALSKAGADRQEMHEHLRQQSLLAWQAVQNGQTNPLLKNLIEDPRIAEYLSTQQTQNLLNVDEYTGIASQRAQALALEIRSVLDRSISMDADR
jgi:adenylosuccinate lyase